MHNALNRRMRRIAVIIGRFIHDEAGEIPMEVGFPFSAWFFATTVALTFLDVYVLGGKGLQNYLDVPIQVLAHSRSMVNI